MQHIQTLYRMSGTSFVPAFSASSLDALKIKIFSREVIYLKETEFIFSLQCIHSFDCPSTHSTNRMNEKVALTYFTLSCVKEIIIREQLYNPGIPAWYSLTT